MLPPGETRTLREADHPWPCRAPQGARVRKRARRRRWNRTSVLSRHLFDAMIKALRNVPVEERAGAKRAACAEGDSVKW